jgi:hypothetical protein
VEVHGQLESKLVDSAKPRDQVTGEVYARVSDYGVDRHQERFARHAFDAALARLREEDRALPVLFGHDVRTLTPAGRCLLPQPHGLKGLLPARVGTDRPYEAIGEREHVPPSVLRRDPLATLHVLEKQDKDAVTEVLHALELD